MIRNSFSRIIHRDLTSSVMQALKTDGKNIVTKIFFFFICRIIAHLAFSTLSVHFCRSVFISCIKELAKNYKNVYGCKCGCVVCAHNVHINICVDVLTCGAKYLSYWDDEQFGRNSGNKILKRYNITFVLWGWASDRLSSSAFAQCTCARCVDWYSLFWVHGSSLLPIIKWMHFRSLNCLYEFYRLSFKKKKKY